MFKFFTSLFSSSADKKTELVVTEENRMRYFEKAMSLIEPYMMLSGNSPQENFST